MALIHPRSLERWQEWQESRHRARRAKHAVTGAVSGVTGAVRSRLGGSAAANAGSTSGPTGETSVDGGRFTRLSREGVGTGERRVLLGVDSASPTSRASLLTALPYLDAGVDVLLPTDVPLDRLPELGEAGSWTIERSDDASRLLEGRGIGAVATLGQHLEVGRLAHRWAQGAAVPAAVVQHGALTPFAPPLPPDTTLLAWTDADGAFYRSGRDDLEIRTIGSQLLWQAAHEGDGEDPAAGANGGATAGAGASAGARTGSSADGRPVFLGQMHGAELARRLTATVPYSFCREEGALYRPHPAEVDVLSRSVHAVMRRRGIVFHDTAIPLRQIDGPVVGIFSTGVLEAAVRGLPAYVVGRQMPEWVHEFWVRYDMRPWRRGGGDPTPAPEVGADEPARLVAQFLEGAA